MTGYRPEDVQAAFAAVVVDEWARAGVTDAVVCPGSRSTPLLIALSEAAERGLVRLHSVLDERSAGFYALGLGIASGRPAPVVTTSGTAAVELHPAVVEAHHSGVPLLAVTADRPPELQDCGAPQTVHQVGLYGEAVRWEAHPGVPELVAARSWRSLASRSVTEALGGARRPGPVHLNLAFREPLDGVVPDELLASLGGRPEGAPWHRRRAAPELRPPREVVELLARTGERGLILAGAGAGHPEAVWELARAAGWPVLADPTSGCRRPGAIAAADALLRTPVAQGWRPDVVLRLGAPWASRVVNEWVGALDCLQVLVDPWGTWSAPDRLPGEVVVAGPEPLCRAVVAALPGGQRGRWAAQWAQAEAAAQRAIDGALAAETAASEPGTARRLLAAVPEGSTVVVSSSMPVRDLETWSQPRSAVRVLANRGANGIDGVLSTALGVAAEGSVRTVALLGDLAFLYDASALLVGGRTAAGARLDVVVVDNDGGGIFSFLPQATSQPGPRFERLWGTPHGLDLAAVARGYGAAVQRVEGPEDLGGALGDADRGEGMRVLVVKTDRAANVVAHRRLYEAVAAALDSAGLDGAGLDGAGLDGAGLDGAGASRAVKAVPEPPTGPGA
jgi:2-succinyl-5-enolpyruvyl-6-hydroxy-3-cyclohexene-1-carboxylate synthase